MIDQWSGSDPPAFLIVEPSTHANPLSEMRSSDRRGRHERRHRHARSAPRGEVFRLSSLVQATASGPVDLNEPPPGAWYQEDFDGFVVGATTRHPIAFILVPFMCVWSGFSLGGIYGSQIAQGRFNLFESLFGIPFIIGTLIFGSMALMSVCGKVIVRVRDSGGNVHRRRVHRMAATVRSEAGHGHPPRNLPRA